MYLNDDVKYKCNLLTEMVSIDKFKRIFSYYDRDIQSHNVGTCTYSVNWLK